MTVVPLLVPIFGAFEDLDFDKKFSLESNCCLESVNEFDLNRLHSCASAYREKLMVACILDY